MKYWLLAFGILISSAIQAQFGFYTQGGGNVTKLHVTRNPGGVVEGNFGYGWQASVGAEYHTQFGFFAFVEAGVSQQEFGKDSAGTTSVRAVVSQYTYHPLFLNFPLGFGYEFPLSKQLALRVYAGAATQTGIGGTIHRTSTTYGKDTSGNQIIIHSDDTKRPINYGRSLQESNEFRSDLANSVWCLNAGVGLNFSEHFEVTAIFQGVLTNILPGFTSVAEIDKLQVVNVNLKYYFIRKYYNKPRPER